MLRRPPISTRTATLLPYSPLVRSVPRAELEVCARPAVGGRHPADALHALLDVQGRGDGGLADAVDGDPRRVVGKRHDHVAGRAAEALGEAERKSTRLNSRP